MGEVYNQYVDTVGNYHFTDTMSGDHVISNDSFKTINSVNIKGTQYSIDLAQNVKEELYTEFLKKLGQAPIVAHKCHNCGGAVEMNERKHIFVCPYCGCSYAVGVYMVNDRG